MLYAILCYNDEDMVWSWSQEEDAAVMAKLGAVHERWAKAGKLGPSLRLLPTTSATTLRKSQEPPVVIDGPFAETKEQLLGFYVIDVADLDSASTSATEADDTRSAEAPDGAAESDGGEWQTVTNRRHRHRAAQRRKPSTAKPSQAPPPSTRQQQQRRATTTRTSWFIFILF